MYSENYLDEMDSCLRMPYTLVEETESNQVTTQTHAKSYQWGGANMAA